MVSLSGAQTSQSPEVQTSLWVLRSVVCSRLAKSIAACALRRLREAVDSDLAQTQSEVSMFEGLKVERSLDEVAAGAEASPPGGSEDGADGWRPGRSPLPWVELNRSSSGPGAGTLWRS